MNQTLTLVCKLQPTPEQSTKIDALLKAFAEACNVANQSVKPSVTSKTTIQTQVYNQLRERFGLSANQAVRVCARVGANRKTAKLKGKLVKEFKPTSADYDARIFAFREKELNEIRGRFNRVRPSLQVKASRGTRSTRRRARTILKRLSGRERRFQQWLNHSISAFIVREAKQLNAIVAIEELTGIRDRTNQQPRNKTERRRSNSWAFYQLRQFLQYKGIKEGVEVVWVNPAYTSQTCNQCLHIGLRSDKKFKCGHCGWHGDADLNGARNIAALGMCVTHPRGSGLFCSLEQAVSGLQKAPGF